MKRLPPILWLVPLCFLLSFAYLSILGWITSIPFFADNVVPKIFIFSQLIILIVAGLNKKRGLLVPLLIGLFVQGMSSILLTVTALYHLYEGTRFDSTNVAMDLILFIMLGLSSCITCNSLYQMIYARDNQSQTSIYKIILLVILLIGFIASNVYVYEFLVATRQGH